MTSSRRLFGSGRSIAGEIKGRILQRTGLTASVGVAPNKLLAKMASEMNKPDGLTVVRAEEARALLDPGLEQFLIDQLVVEMVRAYEEAPYGVVIHVGDVSYYGSVADRWV